MKSTIHELQKSDSKIVSKTSKYLSDKFQFLTNSRSKTNEENLDSNELTHPRFEVRETDQENTETSKSLLFLMYSEENEVLFV
jgi:hypothetical protein